MTRRHSALLLIALLLAACTSAADYAAQAQQKIELGDVVAAQETLTRALESHPDDVELLLIAGELALQPVPEEHYTPRLALHYALRADRAAVHQDPRATRLLTRAYRAAGGTPLGDTIVQQGLEQLGHRDARAPRRLSAADPDLLEPTAANLREQVRRDAARRDGVTPCPSDRVHVPAGRYPADGLEVTVDAYCVARGGTTGCLDGRTCSGPEARVACTALRAVLGDDPSCADPTLSRCCAEPTIAAWEPDP